MRMKQLHIQLLIAILLLIALLFLQKKLLSPSSSHQKNNLRTFSPKSSHFLPLLFYHTPREDLMHGMLYENDGSRLYQGAEVPHYKYYYINSREEKRPEGTVPSYALEQRNAYEYNYPRNTIPEHAPIETKLKLSQFTVHLIVQEFDKPKQGSELNEESVVEELLFKSEKSIYHYSKFHRVHKIVIIWNLKLTRKTLRGRVIEKLQTIQNALMNPEESEGRVSPRPLPLFIVVDQGVSPNDAFKPHSFIETECVFSIRVGHLVDLKDMDYGFLMWKWFPNLLIGFTTNIRIRGLNEPIDEICPASMTIQQLDAEQGFLRSDNAHYGAICVERDVSTRNMFNNHPRTVMISSMPVTITGSFYHRRFLDMYTYQTPKALHRHVNSHPEHLDLSFSQVVSQHSQHAPIMVKPEKKILIPSEVLGRFKSEDSIAVARRIIQLTKFGVELVDQDSIVDPLIKFVDFKIERVQLRDVT